MRSIHRPPAGLLALILLMLASGGCSSSRWQPFGTPTPMKRTAKAPPKKQVPKHAKRATPPVVTTPLPTNTETPTPATPTATLPPPPKIQAELAPTEGAKLEAEARATLAAAERQLARAEGKARNAEQNDRIAILRGLIQQARSAIAERDWQRAHTLAKKAQVIGNDLANR